ncbi:hypothetical protein LXM94_07240 [Rhizobium sp. TRM95111]|uniref:hypothetical protein n=1 Tax=Rhizobium alarense TaxID=2846851 RepID=UPI001F3884BA|nr:hypothetical protein [Rhizobium alarense]MCF3639763.1 hypothetical protein [Rhizobium alarense]
MDDFIEDIKVGSGGAIRLASFNAWRIVLGEMTGLPFRYRERLIPTSGIGAYRQAPRRLSLCEAIGGEAGLDRLLTPAARRGGWPDLPEEPLLALLCLTVPGGTIRPDVAAACSLRLREMEELMFAIDDGRRTMLDLGRFSLAMAERLAAVAASRESPAVEASYALSGGWDAAPLMRRAYGPVAPAR